MHVLLIPLIAGIFLAVMMGGSGIAASFSPTYGAKLLKRSVIPTLFGGAVLLGALFSGHRVSQTIGEGIIASSQFDLTVTSIMLGAVGLSILLANLLKVPQSTSQSTVFALLAIGVYLSDLNTHNVFVRIVPAWFYLPLIAFFLTYLIGHLMLKPVQNNTHGNHSLSTLQSHKVTKYLVISGSLYVAYAIGANNVANAAGPLYSLLDNTYMAVSYPQILMILVVLLIAPWFGIGGALFGDKLLNTSGDEITPFGPLGALAVFIVTGTLMLLASIIGGIPVALAQINIAAIMGLGVYKSGFKAIFKRHAVRRILIVWIVSPIIAFVIAYALMMLFVS